MQSEQSMMPKEIVSQYERASAIFEDKNSTVNELVDTAQTMLEQSKQYLENCCRHPLCSRTLEEALQYLYQFGVTYPIISALQSLSPHILNLCFHPNGSHCVQTILSLVSRLSRDNQNTSMVYNSVVQDLLVEANLKDLLESQHATQILKMLIRVEAGVSPEDAKQKRRHSFYNIMCEQIFGKGDPLQNKKSELFTVLMKKLFKQLSKIGLNECIRIPDVASLVSTYIIHGVDMEEMYSPIYIICTLLKLDPAVYYARIQKIVSEKLTIEPDEELNQKIKEQYTQQMFKDYPSTQYVFENLLVQQNLQLFAQSFIQVMLKESSFQEIIRSNSQFIFQKCLSNIYNCPQTLMQMLALITDNLSELFELENQQLTANILISCRKFEYVCHSPRFKIPDTIKTEFSTLLMTYFTSIINETHSQQFFIRRLFFPQLSDTQEIILESNFSKNSKFVFENLNKQTEDENEKAKLIELKRLEHEKLNNLQTELKYGPMRKAKCENGFWAVGKEVVLQWLQFTNDSYLIDLVKSFYDSFLNNNIKSQKQIDTEIIILLNHPAGFELFQQFVNNDFIPLHYKFIVANALKGKFEELSNFRLGKMFLSCLGHQFRNRLQAKSKAYDLEAAPIQINVSTLKMILEEIGTPRKLKFLQKSAEGKDLISAFCMEQYILNKQTWENDLKKHMEKIFKRVQGKVDIK
ncbi:Conserved_hypothetical protein [Hexamita inflata]|uniref:Uncharacterized protein n=1 Tax=Hexamita inflata TaxID=28002 RepID=A0AA86REC3_9EUKA|nr:Conserved hypothetical protein [Hexamita inflata]CAI9972531.1 Conserved hypothetical protein [Hexamita inflata]